jgi:pilus assembly protein CpaD
MTALRKKDKRAGYAAAGLAALLLGSALTIPGCGSQEQYFTPSAAPKENRVDWITYRHQIGFDANGAALSNGERARFEKFLSEIDVGYGDQVALALTGAPGQATQMADRRLEAVKGFLRNRAIDAAVAPSAQQGAWDGSVAVVVGRYVVTPPHCPNWEKDPGYDFNNTESSNLGCATTTNLGLMVADPGDLVRSRRVGPADGTAQAKAIEKYREGRSGKAAATVSGKVGADGSSTAAGAETRSEDKE